MSSISEILVDEATLKRRIQELGAEITQDYAGKSLLLVGVLKGAVIFLSELAQRIKLPATFDFMAVSSYGSSTESSGVVRIL
ncbi:MAG: hypoxanthine phosphoribosyltransferase, partial [Firmicutes bacterium]|nr:hypoxanthine phosphoribosyltransferase [Bacillota bacterium]